ncbi:MAG: DUF3253 domain-containing protein [Pseudomonadota bacterium]
MSAAADQDLGQDLGQNLSEDLGDEAIAAAILALLRARNPGVSICPSEVARRLRPSDWRPLMPQVRESAGRLVREGRLRATQRGKAVDPRTARGPIRLALPETLGEPNKGSCDDHNAKATTPPLDSGARSA